MNLRWRPSFWPLNIAAWTVLGVLMFFLRLSYHQSLSSALLLTAFQEPLGILISGLIREAFRRFSPGQDFSLKTAVVVVLMSILATGLQVGLVMIYVNFTKLDNPFWTELEEWLLRLIFFLLLYLAWSFLYFWLRADRSARMAERELLEARQEAQRMEILLLRTHLDPHFLFNALNAISSLLRRDPDTAQLMVHELADYLRYSLDHRLDNVVTLGDELEAVGAYLRIERARFGNDLEVEVEASERARGTKVFCFMLQPLVENATKHSLQPGEKPLRLTIRANLKEDRLVITVRNSGHLPKDRVREGVGLKTLHRRLEIHYPDRYEFALEEKNSEVQARLELLGPPCFV